MGPTSLVVEFVVKKYPKMKNGLLFGGVTKMAKRDYFCGGRGSIILFDYVL